jgi:hypothetical protein
MLDVADTISLHVLGKTHPRPAKKKKKKKKTPIGYPASGSNGLGEKISSGLIDRVARLHARQRGEKRVPRWWKKETRERQTGKKDGPEDPILVLVLVVKRFLLLLHPGSGCGLWGGCAVT